MVWSGEHTDPGLQPGGHRGADELVDAVPTERVPRCLRHRAPVAAATVVDPGVVRMLAVDGANGDRLGFDQHPGHLAGFTPEHRAQRGRHAEASE